MKLYADRIATGLADQCTIKSIFPWSPSHKHTSLSKGMNYAARYGLYPLSLIGKRSDVYHIVDHAYAHLISCLPARRTVVTCHDLMLHKLARGEFGDSVRPPVVATRLMDFSLKFLKRAAVVIADSQATADDLVNYVKIPKELIRVVYCGVDPLFVAPPDPQSRQMARSKFGLGDQRVILHVGNNWFYKNLEGLIRALAVLQSSSSDMRPILLKVGKKLTPEQRDLARSLGVTERIREVGLLSGEDLQSAYWGADALVFPSLWEGFGWPPLEAMASGTPVISSNRGSLGEVVGDAALIIDADVPESIADGIRMVLANESLRNSLIEKGYERVKGFAWDASSARMFQIYKEVSA